MLNQLLLFTRALNVSMNKLLPQFENVRFWQAILLAAFSVLLTWLATISAVAEYVEKAGSEISELGGYSEIAATAFDGTTIIFGLGVYVVAGLLCLMILSVFKGLRASPLAQVIWTLLIFLGAGLAKAFS